MSRLCGAQDKTRVPSLTEPRPAFVSSVKRVKQGGLEMMFVEHPGQWRGGRRKVGKEIVSDQC